MPTKVEFYRQMAEYTAGQITADCESWAAFLRAASRLYKYSYPDQLLIFAQRPDAVACAGYSVWNERMGRYVRRGARGIALLDDSADRAGVHYVFDVSDTVPRQRSRTPWLWQLQEGHTIAVAAMLQREYSADSRDLSQQITDAARRLADEYWAEHAREVLGIVDGSRLAQYDEFTAGVQFKAAATASIAYTVLARCGLQPERLFGQSEFACVLDFSTPAAAGALGTAVSESSGQMLRQIARTIRDTERKAAIERSERYAHEDQLHPERGLSDPRPPAELSAGQASGPVRTDAPGVSEAAPPPAVQQPAAEREAVPPPDRDRRDSLQPSGTDAAAAGTDSGRDGGAESAGPAAVGGTDEHLQSAGGGDPAGRADLQLNFLSDDTAEKAEDVQPSSAFSLSAPDADFAARHLIPGESSFELDGRTFLVERVNTDTGSVSLQDLTFEKAAGFPVYRVESISALRRQLEAQPLAQNFRITDDLPPAGGPKARFCVNLDAIRTLKTVESQNRPATPQEQQVLSRYVGWGGLPDAFDPDKAAWTREYTQLKEALTPDEYAAARSSTLNAHYTSPTIIRAIYEAVGRMGFESGNILEPSCGVGNFFGLLPDHMQDSRLYGVELDSISGRIAQLLYPLADITVAGFETTDRRDFYDLAIGNVPFGSYKVSDKAYDRLNFSIHNYFFAKALDQVRPGGLVVFITSRYTMDSKNEDARRYLSQRADLLGAVRLPRTAFKENAGTEVVSDILFLQKRSVPTQAEPDWVHLGHTDEGFSVNRYFILHPDRILGRLAAENTQYGREECTVLPVEDTPLADQLHRALSGIDGSYQALAEDAAETERSGDFLPADPDTKNFSFALVNDRVYFRENSVMRRVQLNDTALGRVKGMVQLRQIVNELIEFQMQDRPEEQITAVQQRLNAAYDAFTHRYGLLNSRANAQVFAEDSSYYLLCSLENLDENGRFKSKADMFTRRTIRPARPVTHVDTPSEALAVSIGEKGQVDLSFMAGLLGRTDTKSVAQELQGIIFRLPGTDTYVTADEYLSGNVRQKLREARQAARTDEEFLPNLQALEKAQPTDLDASEIDVRLGAVWIDKSYIRQFMLDIFEPPFYLRGSIGVDFSPLTAEWQVSGKSAVGRSDVTAYMTYGTDRANAYRILEDTLNLRDVRIFDTIEDPDGKSRRVLNKHATMLAQQKQQAIRDAFRDWVWKDPRRRQALVERYNELFNSTRPREYDGSHIVFVGMNPEIRLREHQKNAIAHILYGGNTLLAHEVGAGKTFEMAAAAMESKRLGLCRKSMFVVPNHLTLQWANEFLRLYPGARLLVTGKKDFETANRKKFCARIAAGDYDAVIIGHSQFEKIPLSPQRQQRMLQSQIDEIEQALADLKHSRQESFSVKQMEKTRRSLQARLNKLTDTARKDDVITFEQLGVDRLFVDESQAYKNLFLYTKMRNVAGLSTSEAQRSSDMFMKCRYLDEITGGRGVVFASGTPVSNSMSELYTVMRYLQYDTLCRKGLAHFDCWASTFGETSTAIELAPEGTGYRARTRFSKFFNLPELMSMFKEVADIKTSDQLQLPVPAARFETVVVPPSEHQKTMVQQLSERASAVHSGTVDPSVDNMLKITSDGRKLGLDQRLLDPLLPDDPGSKLNACVRNVLRIRQEGCSQKLTQLIFCDLSVPRQDGGFSVYTDIRAKLLAAGVPEQEIAFIHDADTEVKKKELFARVRAGQVRVLIGSTQKMGAGTNCQDRLVALHHLDVGWRPSDMTQRNGRIIRQGNRNKEVQIYQYVTEGTFDAYLWQTLENKQKFISQIMTSKSPVRSCEDVDEQVLSYAEVKALCAGNPLIREKMDLDIEVARLKVLKADHQSRRFRLEDRLLQYFPAEIGQQQAAIRGLASDLQTLAQHPIPTGEFAGMTVGKTNFSEKEKAGAAILAACKAKTDDAPVMLGSYRGFGMELSFDAFSREFQITLQGKMSYRVSLGPDARGNLLRLDNALDGITKRLQVTRQLLEDLQTQKLAAEAELAKPFPQEDELVQKSARLAQLDAQLNMEASPGEEKTDEHPRTSVREELKRSLPHRVTDKPPHPIQEER